MAVTLASACRFSAQDRALQCAEQTTVKCPSSFQFRAYFCRRTVHFHDCRSAPPKVRCFPKFRHANWSRTVTAFRTLRHTSGINFFSRWSALVL